MITQDWKKHAAQVMENDDMVEIQFLEQAYTFIQNKARPLLQDPYRLGFEISYKNDNASRMVGLFIFRVNKHLYYAPVFFINGEIKGTDLLYRHSKKLFTALTPEWCEYEINKSLAPQGQPVSRNVTQEAPQGADLGRLAYPPSIRQQSIIVKRAMEELFKKTEGDFSKETTIGEYASRRPVSREVKNACAAIRISEASASTWEALGEISDRLAGLEKEAAQEKPGEMLREFIGEVGMPGIAWIKQAMETSYDFANALYTYTGIENYVPPEVIERETRAREEALRRIEKRAAAKEKIVLHVGMTEGVKQASEEAREDFLKKGYWFEDTRKEAAAVADSDGMEMETVGDCGVYSLMLRSGAKIEVLSGKPFPSTCEFAGEHEYSRLERSCGCGQPNEVSDGADPVASVCWDPKAKKLLIRRSKEAFFGSPKMDREVQGITKPRAGKHYVLYLTDTGQISPPFKVIENDRVRNGLREYKIDTSAWEDSKNIHTVLINPSAECARHESCLYGKNAVFLEVEPEIENGNKRFSSDEIPGTPSEVNSHLIKAGALRVTVKQEPFGKWSCRLEDASGSEYFPASGPLKTAARLMLDAGVRQNDAERMMKAAGERGKAVFWVKRADAPRLLGHPDFTVSFDPDLGVPVEEPQAFLIGTEKDDYSHLVPTRQRLGDGVQPLEAGSQVYDMTPNQLHELSKSRHLGSIFEHGVIGDMARTFDSVSQVDRFLPDMERGNDRLARTLFLLYWKPADFAHAYGTDDQAGLEEKVLSTFKQQAELILELLKKSPAQPSAPAQFA